MSASSLGPDAFAVPPGISLVGRGDGANLLIPHPGVSRRHAELLNNGHGVSVRDLGGQVGTRVNGVAVRIRKLKDEDQVEFGPVAYKFRKGWLRRVAGSIGVLLETSGLFVTVPGRVLLANVSVSILPGSFVGVLGPSGAGKSTFIKACAGLLPVPAGQVMHDRLDLVWHRGLCIAQMGYVPQEVVVYPSLTCRESLRFALELRSAGDLTAAEIADTVQQTLLLVHLQNQAELQAGVLSGGQQKRLSLAHELLTRPRLLFLDEPTSGLDPAGEAHVMQILGQLARRGTTVVCSTHVLDNLASFGQVIVVAGGTVQFSGPVDAMLRRFSATNTTQMYERLEKIPSPTTAQPSGTPPSAPKAESSPVQLGRWVAQSATLLHRSLLLVARDRGLLLLLFGQPLVIGLLVNLSQVGALDLNKFYFFSVLTAIWLGLNNTAREIVRERPLRQRERTIGVPPTVYFASKLAQFAILGVIQMSLLVLVVYYLNFLTPTVRHVYLVKLNVLFFWLVLWLTYLCAMLLGLLISCLAGTQERALAALPLVLLPQILLTGEASGLAKEGSGAFQSIPLLLQRGPSHIVAQEWVLELFSFGTYTRPAMVLLTDLPGGMEQDLIYHFANWCHLLAALLVTGCLLHWVLRHTESGSGALNEFVRRCLKLIVKR